MFEKLGGLFRRNDKPSSREPTAKTPVAGKPAAPAAVADAAAEAARAARGEEAARLLAGTPSGEDLLRIARDATLAADLRCQALARLDDATALRAIALDDKVARVRLAAAEKLVAADDLEVLRRDSRDKAVQRHARDTLKALREQEKSAEDTRTRIAHLLLSLEQHAARAFEPLYDAKLDSLEASWRGVAAQAGAGEQERFAELAALARDTVNRHAEEIAARARAVAAKQELIAACHELEGMVRQLHGSDLAHEWNAVTALSTTQQTRWLEAASLTVVDAPLEKRYRAAVAVLEAWLGAAAELPRIAQDASPLLSAIAAGTTWESDDEAGITPVQLDDWLHEIEALQARLRWPEGLQQPPMLADLASARGRLLKLEKARRLSLQEQVAQLRKRRHVLKRMIEGGQLRSATRTLAWLRKRIAELPAAEAAAENTALEPVEQALKELHAWYDFASTPKKQELCERIEQLAGEAVGAGGTTDAEAIAARAETLRALREQWNTLCAADPDADPDLRKRFDAAADAAWAPCAAWYAEIHRRQDDNLRSREALCDELAAAVVAPACVTTADWKALEQRERDARARWKSLEPVRWPEARACQERFTALIGEMRALLEAERMRAATARDALVARATQLKTHEPLESAVQAAKKLQDEWKHVGYSDPREDRRQWQAFRAELDAVFARRDDARKADKDAREAARLEAERQQADTERKRIEEQQRRAARAEQLKAARREEITLALALAEAESAWLAGEPVDSQALAERLQALAPGTLARALQARLAQLQGDAPPGDAGVSAQAGKLALLTLDLEIAHELESPPAFAAQRMQRKVERLNAALRGQRGKDEDNPPLLDAWLACGPVPADTRRALQARIAVLLAQE